MACGMQSSYTLMHHAESVKRARFEEDLSTFEEDLISTDLCAPLPQVPAEDDASYPLLSYLAARFLFSLHSNQGPS